MSLLRSRIVPSFFSSRSEPIVMPRIFVLLIFIFEMFLPLKGLIFFLYSTFLVGGVQYGTFRGGGERIRRKKDTRYKNHIYLSGVKI